MIKFKKREESTKITNDHFNMIQSMITSARDILNRSEYDLQDDSSYNLESKALKNIDNDLTEILDSLHKKYVKNMKN